MQVDALLVPKWNKTKISHLVCVKVSMEQQQIFQQQDLHFERIHDGILYRLAKSKEDAERVANFYWQHFLKDEPMMVSRGGLVSFPKVVRDEVIEAVHHGLSLMAIEEKSGMMVGMRLSIAKDREECQPFQPVLEDYLSKYPATFAYTIFLFDSTKTPADMFAERQDIQRIYYMMALGTHNCARGRGIASRLVQFSFEVARMAGCDSVFVYATHSHSQRIFDKLGMTRVAERSYKEVVIAGQKPFEQCKTDKFAVYFYKFQ